MKKIKIMNIKEKKLMYRWMKVSKKKRNKKENCI